MPDLGFTSAKQCNANNVPSFSCFRALVCIRVLTSPTFAYPLITNVLCKRSHNVTYANLISAYLHHIIRTSHWIHE